MTALEYNQDRLFRLIMEEFEIEDIITPLSVIFSLEEKLKGKKSRTDEEEKVLTSLQKWSPNKKRR